MNNTIFEWKLLTGQIWRALTWRERVNIQWLKFSMFVNKLLHLIFFLKCMLSEALNWKWKGSGTLMYMYVIHKHEVTFAVNKSDVFFKQFVLNSPQKFVATEFYCLIWNSVNKIHKMSWCTCVLSLKIYVSGDRKITGAFHGIFRLSTYVFYSLW